MGHRRMQRTGRWREKPFETWAPDSFLLEKTRHGDGQAFGALASRYWATVYRVGWNMLADAAAAAKVAEATFAAVLESGAAFPSDVPFTISLYRLALGESWKRLRPVTQVARERSIPARAREALQRLDSLDRAAYVLREVEELSTAETAEVLGISPASIRERIHRATLVLASDLGGAQAFSS
jgi:RNA polymerase sigma-70 factor (ECF subfamily)